MKKLLLLCGAAALSVASYSAQAESVRFVNFGKKPVTENIKAARAALVKTAANKLWRATKITDYYWVISDYETMAGQWEGGEPVSYKYNSDGNVTENGNEYEKNVYEYDADGRCVNVTHYNMMDGTFVPVQKYDYAYDPVVKNLVVSELAYNYEENQWKMTDGRRTVIIRNADNNVTAVRTQYYSMYTETPGWQDDGLVEIGYGSDKKANSIKEYYYEGTQSSLEGELVDIVWEQTDGQIVYTAMDEADFFMGANRMKSAKANGATTYPYAGDIYYNVVYKANDKGYKVTGTLNGSTFMYSDYTVLDAYGSYTQEDFEIDYDSQDDGTYLPDGPQLYVYTTKYDAYGLLLENSEISYIDGDKANGISTQSGDTGTVTYDQTHGYPLEYVRQQTYDGRTQNVERKIYGDYVNVKDAGVEGIIADDNAPVEYYNLQGVRVDNPASGLYIRRQGKNVSKVIIK